MVPAISSATQGGRPHSKPPFWTTVFDEVGTQAELDAEAVGVVDGVIDAAEVVWGVDEVIDAAEVRADVGDAAEVTDDTGFELEIDDTGGCFGFGHLHRQPND